MKRDPRNKTKAEPKSRRLPKRPSDCEGVFEPGDVNVPAEDFLPRNEKLRITMWLDGDVYDAFKAAAAKQGLGYQTLINQKLRESLPGLDKTLADRVAALEEELHRRG